MRNSFLKLSEAQWAQNKYVCVGLDIDPDKLPAEYAGLSEYEGVVSFAKRVIDATKEIAAAYKPNSAFFEGLGTPGWAALEEIVRHIHAVAPEVVVIDDAKRADIANTNNGYVEAIFNKLDADAITVHPYLGGKALAPFIEHHSSKGVIVLCRTSNDGAGEFQDLVADGDPLYMHVARRVSDVWNVHGNCALVTGATYPEELVRVREIAPNIPLLIPGIGAQGGDLEKTVRAAKHRMFISASRSILYAADPRAAAQEMHDGILKAL